MTLPFAPQNPIDNLDQLITRLAVKTHSSITLKRIDESAWSSFLSANESSLTGTYSPDRLDEANRSQPFNWSQSDKSITVTIQLPSSDITVDSTSISSSALQGTWWESPTNVEVIEKGDVTELFLTVNSRWPCLIRGGNPDGLSCYFLAEIALELKQPALCAEWLRQGATLENKVATVSYAMLLFDMKEFNAAFHFLCRAVAAYNDGMCGVVLSRMLIDGAVYADARIAEQLLYRLCANGVEEAFIPLAKLYLSGAEGVAQARENARELLKIAVSQWKDEQAQELLKENGMDAEPVSTSQQSETSTLEWLLLGGFAAGVAAVVYFAARASRQSHK
jgi:TPR repeat protein